jgi:amino acid adenylation domain-containing protein
MSTQFQASNSFLATQHAPSAETQDVVKLVTMQARRSPNAIAIHSNGEQLRYEDLDRRSQQIASALLKLGAGPNKIVGLYMKRTPSMVAAALGILKSGAAYMPLDPALPDQRISAMLSDSGCMAIVTAGCGADRFSVPQLVLDRDADLLASEPIEIARPSAINGPDQLAYVIYTSGSTGSPKGVAITHGALLNLVRWHHNAFRLTPQDRASHIAGLSFDAAVWELWPTLAAGASLHLAPEDVRVDPVALRDWLVESQITIAFIPTPLAERLISLAWPPNTKLRIMLTGGDALHTYPPATLPFKLINNYGPTECAVVATSGEVTSGEYASAPRIGKAIDGVCLHVLDSDLQPVPDGAVGELFIGGAGVARGYVNSPQLTAERFLPDPFHPSSRMYRTGDLVSRASDGQLTFMGRQDEQIKIRGYRIEPNEIAFVLNSHPLIEASAVGAYDENGDKRLVAHIVIRSDEVTSDELQQHLARQLPDYMIPSAFVPVESLPITTNGKIDRAALPHPTAENSLGSSSNNESTSLIEERLAGIVSELLKVPDVHPDDNFFRLGGHSLMGAQLIARIRNVFGVELSLRQLFGNPTIAELSNEVESLISNKLAVTVHADK